MRLARVLLTVFRPLFFLLFPYKVVGKEYINQELPQRVMLCCNHISLLDPVYLLMCQKHHVYFMAKGELFRNRLSAWFLGGVLGAFPVERGKGDRDSLTFAQQLIEEGKMMGIFPEGQRSKDGELLRAKSGAALIAAKTGATVLPACVVTKQQRVRLLRKTTIVFGPPLTPATLHLEPPESAELRYASRQIMQAIGDLKASVESSTARL